MTYPVKSPRKLIEVALPLDAINAACGREKSIRHGHPSTLHLWWARRPLAAARAVIFAQLVNDPGYQQGGGFKYGRNKKEAAIERKRLFKIIEDLVQWESTTDEAVLERARAEIRRSWREVCDLNKDHPKASSLFDPERIPAFHDPFAGGGAIPLEAQRLGLAALATDLNPVAVLINKGMIEFPPKFAGCAPVGPQGQNPKEGTKLALAQAWPGTSGLAEDVRRYGAWMLSEARSRIGSLYPRVEITKAVVRERPDLESFAGKKLTVIAWLWARTVKSPNPAFSSVDVPLASSFLLANKEGKECFVEPVVTGARYRFTVVVGVPPPEARGGTKLARGANFTCIVSGAAIEPEYIRAEGMAQRMGARLMAVVAEGVRGRVYLAPTPEMEAIADGAEPEWIPDASMPDNPRWFSPPLYGLTKFRDVFTKRQLVALAAISDLVIEARTKVRRDAEAAGMVEAAAYADAVSVYLTFILEKLTESHSTLCTWSSAPKNELVVSTFRRQAIPMTWDFAEANPFADSSGSIEKTTEAVARVIAMALPATSAGAARQADAASQDHTEGKFVSTDPPYYDNIGYADLSDYFYVWLRRTLRGVFPDIFATLTVPKAEELVATPYRHGSRDNAEAFFLDGMTRAMRGLAMQAHPEAPLTIYYAFKQSDTEGESGTSSTGWETFLDAVLRAGLQVTGTWPMRTERESRSVGIGTNSLASSIVLVCRRRSNEALSISRRDFLRELNTTLPDALDEMTRGSDEERSPVAPVDLSQAIIGPGMAIFSKYAAVLEADGTPMGIRAALQLINRFLAEDDFDADSQFCLRWFEQNGWKAGRFGDADTLSRAKGTSVDGVKAAGVIESGGGSVRLLKWAEYATDWDPATDARNPVWETLHHLIRALKQDGESAAGRLLALVKDKAEPARQLAYRLYTLCERQGWAEDARAYNELITSWSGIEGAAATAPSAPTQGKLFD